MAKLSAFCGLIALFALLGVVNAHAGHNFYVTGKVYCDNCAAGFPTRISPAISGATVAVECKDPAGKRLFYNEQHTDNDGLFSIAVKGEHEHEACEAFTVSSPTSCNLKTDSSRGLVYLTNNNGISSDERKTGPFAFRIFVLAFITESFLLTTNRMGACGRRMVVNLEDLSEELEEPEELEELSGLERLESLEDLEITRCDGLKRIHGLAQLTKLQRLNVQSNSDLEELPDIEGSQSLKEVNAWNCPKLKREYESSHRTCRYWFG